jgi:tetratricopeptide (TPR) repeat protein
MLWATVAVFAADENLVTMALRAQTDFDRVELNYKPSLPETMACVQSQAMVLPVTRPMELSLIYYRKGYCGLLGATITNNRSEYRVAARDFDKAIEAWPERVKRGAVIPPVSSGLRVLAAAAHLLADGNSDPRVNRNLDEAVGRPICVAADMPASKCQALVEIGKLWLGWLANREGRLEDAARAFEPFGGAGWRELIAGKLAMKAERFPEAAAAFRQAVDQFAQQPKTGLTAVVGPRPDRADALFRLGQAQFEIKEYAAAITSMDEAVKLRPENARAMFLRGRAREKLGQPGSADFDLASRTAFANVNAPGAGGQAHLYRGVALYRKQDYARAEQEFSSALNFDSGTATDDASAWRHMAAVAAGACGPSATLLQQSLDRVSSYFPKDEAVTLLKKCPGRAISEVVHPSTQ